MSLAASGGIGVAAALGAIDGPAASGGIGVAAALGSIDGPAASGGIGVAAALGAIGCTPLLRLPLPAGVPGSLWAKAEFLQPGGSVKDRAALGCIQYGLRTGGLRPGQPVFEMTSGNMGAGLAIVCGVLGHPFTAYMSAGNSPARAEMMRALGARVVLVDQVDGSPGRVTGPDIAAAAARAEAEARQDGGWYVDQFRNPGSILAHQHGTAEELWEQTGGRVDAFVACVGTGGTLIGCARGLKAHDPSISVVAVEPANAPILAGAPVTDPCHVLQGSGYGAVPPLWDASVVDGYATVTDADAVAARAWLAQRCGLHVGFTAAANVHAATEWLRQQDRDRTAVTVLCDTGLKYPR